MNQDNQNLQNPKKLEEGQEVSLNLPEPAHRVDPTEPLINTNHSEDYEKTNPGGTVAAYQPIQADVVIEKKPKINLSPQSPAGNPGMPLNEKQKKALSKLQKIRQHRHWYNIKLVVGTVMVFILIFNSQWFISQFIYLFNRPQSTNTQSQQPAPTQPEQPAEPSSPTPPAGEVVGPQNEIIIPKIGVRAPLVFINTTNEADVLKALRDGVVHYYGTAYPGENGNSVFFGHSSNDWWEAGNYKFVFVLLEKLTVGDQYEIHYNSRKYVYTITETKVVEPTDLSVLNQTAEPTSTLITCTPPGTSWRRFIVHAKQVSPAPAASSPSRPQSGQNQNTTLPATNSGGQAQLPSAPPSIWEQFVSFFQGLFGSREESSQPSQPAPSNQHLPEVN